MSPAGVPEGLDKPIGGLDGLVAEINLPEVERAVLIGTDPQGLRHHPHGRLAIDLAADVVRIATRLLMSRRAVNRAMPIVEAAQAVVDRPDARNLARLASVCRGLAPVKAPPAPPAPGLSEADRAAAEVGKVQPIPPVPLTR
jgi:hypothetical protein